MWLLMLRFYCVVGVAAVYVVTVVSEMKIYASLPSIRQKVEQVDALKKL